MTSYSTNGYHLEKWLLVNQDDFIQYQWLPPTKTTTLKPFTGGTPMSLGLPFLSYPGLTGSISPYPHKIPALYFQMPRLRSLYIYVLLPPFKLHGSFAWPLWSLMLSVFGLPCLSRLCFSPCFLCVVFLVGGVLLPFFWLSLPCFCNCRHQAQEKEVQNLVSKTFCPKPSAWNPVCLLRWERPWELLRITPLRAILKPNLSNPCVHVSQIQSPLPWLNILKPCIM